MSTQERIHYLIVKDTIDSCYQVDRDKINAIATDIRERIAGSPGHGMMAVALVCAELNAGVKHG